MRVNRLRSAGRVASVQLLTTAFSNGRARTTPGSIRRLSSRDLSRPLVTHRHDPPLHLPSNRGGSRESAGERGLVWRGASAFGGAREWPGRRRQRRWGRHQPEDGAARVFSRGRHRLGHCQRWPRGSTEVRYRQVDRHRGSPGIGTPGHAATGQDAMRSRDTAQAWEAARARAPVGSVPYRSAAVIYRDHARRLVRHHWGSDPIPRYEGETQALRIGPLAVVSLPGEFFSAYGMQIKANSPAPVTLIAGWVQRQSRLFPHRGSLPDWRLRDGHRLALLRLPGSLVSRGRRRGDRAGESAGERPFLARSRGRMRRDCAPSELY